MKNILTLTYYYNAMTIRTLFTIFLKMLGTWLFVKGLFEVPEMSIMILTALEAVKDQNTFFSLLLLVLYVFLYFIVLRMLIFKTDWFIEQLSLDEGYVEEKIDLNMKQEVVLRAVIIALGAYIVSDALPSFVVEFLTFLKENQYSNYLNILGLLLRLLIGGVILLKNKKAVSLLS